MERAAAQLQPVAVIFGRGEVEEDLVLAGGEPVHRPGSCRVAGAAHRYVDTARLEEGENPVLARTTVDVSAVVL
jgi:hypothetical protein